ncbi:MAG: NAD(P)-binding domain-containing protein [Planctomycetota bacterium]
MGGGPIGLEVAIALMGRGQRVRVLEAGAIGHTILWWAPQTRWFSSNERIAIAGVPLLTQDQSKCSREGYLTYLRGVVQQYRVDVRTFTKVIHISGSEGNFQVHTQSSSGSGQVACESVVLAVGGTDHPNTLNVPGQQLPHVDGYLRETHRYHGRRVLIIGGRNSAIEAALRLHHAGADVTLCYRGAGIPEDHIKYWLLPEIKGLIRAERIAAYFGVDVQRITENEVILRSNGAVENAGDTFAVVADDVLSLIGYRQDTSLFSSCGIECAGDNLAPVYDQSTMQTNREGIYIAGTAIAGTQSSRYRVFLENCHDHAEKIAKAICKGTKSQRAIEFKSSEMPYEAMARMEPES